MNALRVPEAPEPAAGMSRRMLLRRAGLGVGTVLVFGSGAIGYRAYDQGVLEVGDGAAYEPWSNWSEHAGLLPLVGAAILAPSPHTPRRGSSASRRTGSTSSPTRLGGRARLIPSSVRCTSVLGRRSRTSSSQRRRPGTRRESTFCRRGRALPMRPVPARSRGDAEVAAPPGHPEAAHEPLRIRRR